jgi:hypothetical protein
VDNGVTKKNFFERKGLEAYNEKMTRNSQFGV